MSNIPFQDIGQGLDPERVEVGRKALRDALRLARMSSGLKQAEVAARLGVPQSFVSKYESGQRKLDLVEMSAVCAALQISLPDLLSLWSMQMKDEIAS